MFRALHTAATGMEAQQLKIDLIANNLSNVNTTGFKKARGDFQELLYQTLRAPGATTGEGTQLPTGTQVGLGVRHAATRRLHTQGSLIETGDAHNVAIQGEGFFVVARPGGDLAYSRAGDFTRDADGRLVTPDGYPVDPAIVIPPGSSQLTIGADGTVTAMLPGEVEPADVGRIELASFVNPAGLLSLGGNLYAATAASGPAVIGSPGEDGLGSLLQSHLEGSNVQVVDEMIAMIVGQRSYEMSSKVIQAADQMLRSVANLR